MVRLSLIVKQENLQRPLILLGHNMGSFAGQQYVLDHSDLIDASPCPGPALSIDSCNSRSQRRQRPLRASAYTVRSVEPRSRVANAFMKAHCVSHGSNQWPTNLSFAASLKTCRPRPSSPDTLRFAHPLVMQSRVFSKSRSALATRAFASQANACHVRSAVACVMVRSPRISPHSTRNKRLHGKTHWL